jgi:hypothetical protein
VWVDSLIPTADRRLVKHPRISEQKLKQSAPPAAGRAVKNELMVTAREGEVLSPAQMQFNKLIKQLENTRVKHQREQDRLDALAAHCAKELMPLVDEIHRVNFQLVIEGVAAWKSIKLNERRREALADLLCGKASEVIQDSSGLTEEEVRQMKAVIEELEGPVSPEETKSQQEEEFDYLRSMMEGVARQAGVKLDLSDLDLHGDPAEFERKLKERVEAMMREAPQQSASTQSSSRKPTKAQLEREKKKQEAEEAKKRDLKSLYKQLAKVLHPDLETDPVRKLQKEEWMKRLTTAHSTGNLRELLSIEMEWLGVEASNLTSATDDKLKVYCTVLKEQIAELKMQMHFLLDQPQYAILHRFANRLMGFVPNPTQIKKDLLNDIKHHKEMLNVLQQGGAPCTRMISRWADEHARTMYEDDFSF